MKAHIDCPCSFQPRLLSPSGQAHRQAGGKAFPMLWPRLVGTCVYCVWTLVGVMTPSVSWPQAFTHPSNRKGSSKQRWVLPQPCSQTWHYLGQCLPTTSLVYITNCTDHNGTMWLPAHTHIRIIFDRSSVNGWQQASILFGSGEHIQHMNRQT